MISNATDKRPAVIVLGALSAIAEAAARIWAERGARLILAGRDSARLEAVAADLRLRGAEVETFAADLAAPQAWQALPEMAERLGRVDAVLLAYGTLGDQKRAEADHEEAQQVLTANFTSAAQWCLSAANVLERQKHGTLIVIGSVAGDRGRASNYVYGAAKGGLAVLVQGMAHRLAKAGARAVLIKPGFVNTPMTAHIARKGLLWAEPQTIGRIIAAVADSGSKNRTVVYAPGFWRWIMLVIRTIPNFIFHRTKL